MENVVSDPCLDKLDTTFLKEQGWFLQVDNEDLKNEHF